MKNRTYDPDLIPMPQQDLMNGCQLTDRQKLAERTNGVATRANAVTLAGVALVLAGCNRIKKGHYKSGLSAVMAGAACDFIDGQLSRHDRVAGYRCGRWLDIASDGIKSAALVDALSKSEIYKGLEPAVNYSPKVASWAVNSTSQFILGNESKSSKSGKIAEASRWLSPTLAISAKILEKEGQPRASFLTRKAGHLATALSFTLGAKATKGYSRNLKR